MSAVQDALLVTDQVITDAFRERAAACGRWTSAVCVAAEALHPDAAPFGSRGRVVGIRGKRKLNKYSVSYDLDPVPDGWRWVQSRDCYRPRQGKPGKPAQDWLDSLPKYPGDPRGVLTQLTGAPVAIFLGGRMYEPGSHLDSEGRVWVIYGCRLDAKEDGDPRPVADLDALRGVRRAKLSEYHAAREATIEARAAVGGAA